VHALKRKNGEIINLLTGRSVILLA